MTSRDSGYFRDQIGPDQKEGDAFLSEIFRDSEFRMLGSGFLFFIVKGGKASRRPKYS